jgi:P4 family phage/plasmid primase-like protien
MNNDNNDIKTLLKTFDKFTKEHRSNDNNRITHTTYVGGKYTIEGKDYDEFMNLYGSMLDSDHDVELYFIEKPSKHGVSMLLIDVDFDQNSSKRKYTDEHIKDIIISTNNFLIEHFDIDERMLKTYVTQKEKPTQRNEEEYKDGFHIYYPELPMEEKYRIYVMDFLISSMIDKEFLKGIKYTSDEKNIFDMSIIRSNGMTMIGSKKPNGQPYMLTHIYDEDCNDLYNQENMYEFDNMSELAYILSNQRHDADSTINAKIEYLDDINTLYAQYDYGAKKTKGKASKINKNSNNSSKSSERSAENNKLNINYNIKNLSIIKQKEIEQAQKLVRLLSEERATSYDSWKRTGFALYAIHESLYNDFVEFSKKNIKKYKEGKVTCETIWRIAPEYRMNYSIKTLRHWARMDDEDNYYKTLREINDDIFGQAESCRDADIAQVIYELYKDRFACVDIKKKKWYEFKDHKWILTPEAHTLEDIISKEVRQILIQYCSEKLAECASNKSLHDQDSNYKKFSRLVRVFDTLGDTGKRDRIVRACANKFYDSKFPAKLDANPYLVGFENGVYDLKEMSFREGLPSDYVTMSVGYDWVEYEEDDHIFQKIDGFFSQVQTEDDMREHLYMFIASIFRGVPDSKVHMFTGGGGNGKSATIDFIRMCIGDYFGVVPVTLLTRKKGGSSNATPELADKFGKRFIVIQEPEHNDVIFVGQMKEYSGKDTIMARPLYGDPFYYVPQFKLVLTCNVLPHIPSSDQGTWRRLRVIPYESEFIEHDKEIQGPRQFYKDEDICEEFANLAPAFVWRILTKYYPIYEKGIDGKKYKYTEPKKVKSFTDDYRKDSDVFMEFICDFITKTNNNSDTESIDLIYSNFKNWYCSSYSDKPPVKKQFVAYLKKAGFKVENQKLIGGRLADELE